ncbi:hypothetical protein [Prevotella ihumii]|uniref:hypothetical protein n=1 Tax=Prevotella ihumii TaxID=1917878 RepID=UPI00098265C2|nr:hypothetical protein [Prevotella ihumii]
MEEKTEKITKYNDKLFTINKEIDEDIPEAPVRQKKPYVAPKCEVIKLEGGDILNGWIIQASIQEPPDGGEILDAKSFEFSEEDINMNASWND